MKTKGESMSKQLDKQLQDEIEEFVNKRFIELFFKKRGAKK